MHVNITKIVAMTTPFKKIAENVRTSAGCA